MIFSVVFSDSLPFGWCTFSGGGCAWDRILRCIDKIGYPTRAWLLREIAFSISALYCWMEPENGSAICIGKFLSRERRTPVIWVGRRAYGPPVLFPSASDLTIRKATGAVGYPLSLRSQWELHIRPLQFLVIAVAQAELNLREETFEAVKQSEALHLGKAMGGRGGWKCLFVALFRFASLQFSNPCCPAGGDPRASSPTCCAEDLAEADRATRSGMARVRRSSRLPFSFLKHAGLSF